MTYKAYIDNIKAKTGKDPEYFQTLAKEKGLTKYGELLGWLKTDFDLGTVTQMRSFCTFKNLNLSR